MSILKDFYTLKSIKEQEENKFTAEITLNADHEIFNGHFPGNPVTPGVCMMQIVKDISEKITERKLMVNSANNVKFMAIINPEETPDITLDFDISSTDESVKVKNITSFGETIALKMSVNYKIQ